MSAHPAPLTYDARGLPRLTPAAREALSLASDYAYLRREGLMAERKDLRCCGRYRSVRVQHCESCGRDASFAEMVRAPDSGR